MRKLNYAQVGYKYLSDKLRGRLKIFSDGLFCCMMAIYPVCQCILSI